MRTVLIFAAGRGLRLRPLTDSTPKPLCTINDIALIDYHLEKLNQGPKTRVFINHAYLGGKIRHHVQEKRYQNLEIHYIAEPPGGYYTGGTITHIISKLGEEPFFAINADIFTDYDFEKLTCPKESLAHLVLIKTPKSHATPNFGLTTSNKLSNHDKQYIFSGIACYHPKLFQEKPQGRVSLVPWLQEAAEQGLATGEVHTGLWFDIGTPERLDAARLAAHKL